MDGENKKKPFGKSKVKCYNFQKSKGKDKIHMAQEDEDEEEKSSLLMVISDEHEDVLIPRYEWLSY